MRIQKAHQRRGLDEDIDSVASLKEGVDTVDTNHDYPVVFRHMERGWEAVFRRRRFILRGSRA